MIIKYILMIFWALKVGTLPTYWDLDPNWYLIWCVPSASKEPAVTPFPCCPFSHPHQLGETAIETNLMQNHKVWKSGSAYAHLSLRTPHHNCLWIYPYLRNSQQVYHACMKSFHNMLYSKLVPSLSATSQEYKIRNTYGIITMHSLWRVASSKIALMR